ncbi:hypothetical protein EV421DRAFT_1745860 [Armillaria borealis]|uniref:Uncharacterized protein n=1 Tax=Armillaria borealis TaxID=47425 RepID=A0AA39M613_9AGAR|nr:hypothetical protein EV421DRAFT_1745860 [Armillaria borealis]
MPKRSLEMMHMACDGRDVDSETQQDRAPQRLDVVVDAKDKFRVAEKYRPYSPLAFLLHGLSSARTSLSSSVSLQLPSKPMKAPSSSVSQCSPSTAPQPSSLALAQRLIEKKGLRRHDFTRTVRLTFYGDATFGTACHYATRPLEGQGLKLASKAMLKTPPRKLFSSIWDTATIFYSQFKSAEERKVPHISIYRAVRRVLQHFRKEIPETAPWTSRLIMPYGLLENRERAYRDPNIPLFANNVEFGKGSWLHYVVKTKPLSTLKHLQHELAPIHGLRVRLGGAAVCSIIEHRGIPWRIGGPHDTRQYSWKALASTVQALRCLGSYHGQLDGGLEDHRLWDPSRSEPSFSVSSTQGLPREATNTHGIKALNSFWKRRCGGEVQPEDRKVQNLALFLSTTMSDKVCGYSLNGAAIFHYGVKRGWETDTDGEQDHANELIEKRGLRWHNVRSPILQPHPSFLTDTQFTRTVQLIFYGGALFSTGAGHLGRGAKLQSKVALKTPSRMQERC